MLLRIITLVSLLLPLSSEAQVRQDTLRSELAFHFEINQTGYVVFPSYRVQRGTWMADLGLSYNLSDGSLNKPVIGAELAVYKLLMENEKFRNGLGLAYRYTSSLEHLNSHQYLLTSTQLFQLNPKWAMDLGLGYGLAIDRVKNANSSSSFYYVSQMIQLGCAYTL